MAEAVVATLAALHDAWPDLRDASLVGLDLRHASLDWADARVAGANLLGCRLPDGVTDRLTARGAAVFPDFAALPFAPYRGDLYTYDELMAGGPEPGATLDDRAGAWFQESALSVRDGLIRAVHDATVDAAVARFVAGRRVVGVMGGHALDRTAEFYRTVAVTGRALTRAGFTVATGGGPGVMEAANLGAWMSPYADDALDAALTMLRHAPRYDASPIGYVQGALDVRARWPRGGESLGVPTWVYLNEPTSAFASHIAKYFTNSIREDGLLAIARSGVVYTPGGAGTEQEIFTDTAQNSLTLYQVRSPMVFFGRSFFEREHPELAIAARRQAAEFGWSELFAVCDTAEAVVAFIDSHDPDGAGNAPVERRRLHERGWTCPPA